MATDALFEELMKSANELASIKEENKRLEELMELAIEVASIKEENNAQGREDPALDEAIDGVIECIDEVLKK